MVERCSPEAAWRLSNISRLKVVRVIEGTGPCEKDGGSTGMEECVGQRQRRDVKRLQVGIC
jgi:hypothetical protein